MKTFFVIYTHKKLEEHEIGYKKRYVFNTNNAIAIGDMIETDTYETPLQVVAILPKKYTYFNRDTGTLSQTITGSNVFPIREIKITKPRTKPNVVIGVKQKKG